jgi:hypothetical protein
MYPLPANRNVLLIKWKQLFFQKLHNSQLQQLAALVVKDAEEAEVEALEVAEVTGADEAAEVTGADEAAHRQLLHLEIHNPIRLQTSCLIQSLPLRKATMAMVQLRWVRTH